MTQKQTHANAVMPDGLLDKIDSEEIHRTRFLNGLSLIRFNLLGEGGPGSI